jgi:hypothetical protein
LKLTTTRGPASSPEAFLRLKHTVIIRHTAVTSAVTSEVIVLAC